MRFRSTLGSLSPARRLAAVTIAVVLAIQGCVFRRLDVHPIESHEGVRVSSPVKAHLKDGSIVVFASGVTVSNGFMRGAGVKHDPTLTTTQAVTEVPIDSVVAAESFSTATKGAESVVGSVFGTAAVVVGAALLAVAIFGSCPTVYSHDGGQERLEAETFSHSIAALFEGRDVDRLRAQADGSGRVRLEVRNEALETHYINHLQLLEVRHEPGTVIAPDPDGRLLALRDLQPAAAAVDRAGRDVTAELAASDAASFRTEALRLSRVAISDMDDWLDITAPAPPGASEAVMRLRLKNSLLGTVLFYDVMLAAAGPRALDWMGSELEKISTAVSLGRWYKRRTGLRVSVWQEGGYREVARIGDSGPIAWKDVAVRVPVPPGPPTLRVRLSFTADLWRIDQLSLGRLAATPRALAVPLARVTTADGLPRPEALARLRKPDGDYLQTAPGQRFFAAFDAGPAPPGLARTFLLSSQGYYTEWVRGDWLRAGGGGSAFLPSDDALLAALQRWREVQETMERDFERHRIPVS
jgi:hypothetical protein